jgi:hypothetical protein
MHEGMRMCAGAVMSGSHIDAIPLAGAYDGTLGVVGAIAALDALRRSGYKPQKPIDALMFTSEEPSRFGLGCIGRWALLLLLPPFHRMHGHTVTSCMGYACMQHMHATHRCMQHACRGTPTPHSLTLHPLHAWLFNSASVRSSCLQGTLLLCHKACSGSPHSRAGKHS